MNEWHDHRSFANGRRHPVHGAGANVASLEHAGRAAAGLQEVRDSAERERIRQALDQTDWNVSAAARLLDTERTALHKRIHTLGLKRQWASVILPVPGRPCASTCGKANGLRLLHIRPVKLERVSVDKLRCRSGSIRFV